MSKANLDNILDHIIATFKEQYPNYTIGDYDELEEDGHVTTPAIFLQLMNFEDASNNFNGMFRANCTFRAYVCESFKGQAKRKVRKSALDIAYFIDKNNWNVQNGIFNRAKFSYAEPDNFNEKIQSCEVWLIEWTQEIFIQK